MSWQSQARRDEPNGRRGTHKPSDASCRAAQNHRERTHISKDSGSFALFVSIGILCYVGLNDSGTKDATLFFPRGLLVGKNDNTLVVIKDVSARISLFPIPSAPLLLFLKQVIMSGRHGERSGEDLDIECGRFTYVGQDELDWWDDNFSWP
jgi:hypothetical protein